MDGRRNVVVDGNRPPSDRPAGRRDQQGVQEIVVRSRPACEIYQFDIREHCLDMPETRDWKWGEQA